MFRMENEMRIAICDDEMHQIDLLKKLTSVWAKNNNIKIRINTYDSAEDFKQTKAECDILLLDIQMSGQNGVALAKELRQTNETLMIIFITAIPDYIQEGYEVSALHYLLKPVDENKLYATLNKAYKTLTSAKKSIIITQSSEHYRILLDEIIYIESFGHNINIVTITKRYEVRKNISEIETELDNRFFRCHRSYIVMLKYIKHISANEILLDNGQTIPLSRKLYKDIFQMFIKYYKGEKS